ncbi:unconventional prefoldin RPB5 interactor-like protein [Lucilia sericata]|uniref:unconventional prefoldin RPB5 interactor-like protein n=1 Tax=Lucilia sericata TaxID=13632 RepID=UPI0018A8664C|nr:unconventional prefoldin RPB5 interactor-like protein [Lucilia sericata]
MNKREDALREALQKNEEETQRWQNYLKENETAIENMAMFGKRLTVDVMVPIGKKAFMPGHLLHTNEVLVGHYQGYFSKCTTFKAKEICDLRIKMAKEHLKKLQTEADLWQNKLDKPYAEGVMPSGEEREIIEDFNEEEEKLWKEKHRIRVKQAKQKEREEREKELQKGNLKTKKVPEDKSDEEIFKMLEEAELMEELEQELDKLEVDEVNDDTIRKLMSGEMKLPQEKKRLAHDKKDSEEKTNEESGLRNNIVKKNDLNKNNQINTNNNVQPNPEITNLVNSQEEDDTELDEEPLPEEVTMIKEQAKFLNAEDQIGFYEYQIEIIRQKLQNLPLRTQKELDEKIRLLNVLEHLEELLEMAEETVGNEELAEKDSEVEEDREENEQQPENKEQIVSTTIPTTPTASEANKTNQKRRISFALEDQTLEFRKHEAVTQMLPPKTEKPKRDIIKLDDNEELNKNSEVIKAPLDKKELIQAKVDKNLQFVAENQSKQDFDLVQQILQSSMGEVNTLYIKFKHSQQESYKRDNKVSSDIPASPADFYDLHKKALETETEPSTLFINSYEGEDQVRTPVLKEADRQAAFADPKAEFSNPSLQAKPILKNKSAVDKENHLKDLQQDNINKNKKSKKKSNKKEEDNCFSAYNKVMNDVVEKPLTEPEPLPDVKFIDAHTPKKRISRFKQMRQGTDKT